MSNGGKVSIESGVSPPGAATVGKHECDVEVSSSAREDGTGCNGASLVQQHGIGHAAHVLSVRQGCGATRPDQLRGIDASPAQRAEAFHTQAKRFQPLDSNESTAAAPGGKRRAERRNSERSAEHQLWQSFNDSTANTGVRSAAEVLRGRVLHPQPGDDGRQIRQHGHQCSENGASRPRCFDAHVVDVDRAICHGVDGRRVVEKFDEQDPQLDGGHHSTGGNAAARNHSFGVAKTDAHGPEHAVHRNRETQQPQIVAELDGLPHKPIVRYRVEALDQVKQRDGVLGACTSGQLGAGRLLPRSHVSPLAFAGEEERTFVGCLPRSGDGHAQRHPNAHDARAQANGPKASVSPWQHGDDHNAHCQRPFAQDLAQDENAQQGNDRTA